MADIYFAENLNTSKMETQAKMETVYSKLRKAESFLQQIPEDLCKLFDVKVNHLEGDYVGVSWKTHGSYVGTKVDNIKSISVKEGDMYRWVEMETNGASVTLYQNGNTHITLF